MNRHDARARRGPTARRVAIPILAVLALPSLVLAQSFRVETVATNASVGPSVRVADDGVPHVVWGWVGNLLHDTPPWGAPGTLFSSLISVKYCQLGLDGSQPNVAFEFGVTPYVRLVSGAGPIWEAEQESGQGSFAMGTDGSRHLAYSHDPLPSDGWGTLYYKNSFSGPGPGFEIASSVGTGTAFRRVALDVGPSNDARILYIQGIPTLRYTEFDHGWTTSTVHVAVDFLNHVALAVDSADEPHICFVEDLDLMYATRSSGTWTLDLVARTTGLSPSSVSIAVDVDDEPHVVFWDSDASRMIYARQSGSFWVQTGLATVNVGGGSSIDVASNGDIHIAFCDTAAGSSSVMYANWQDCNDNGLHDWDEIDAQLVPDCNNNGIPDSCDVAAGVCDDCDGNGVPDCCQTDCNDNGVADECDVSSGTSPDCNNNGTPDECDGPDCNGNGVPDLCDILVHATSTDCNFSGVPDECEGLADCDGSGTTDLCEILAGTLSDCDVDGIPDSCEVTSGTETDCNGNSQPDRCESGPMLTMPGGGGAVATGDVNGDGLSDVIVGHPYHEQPGSPTEETGRAYLYYGASPKDTTPDRDFFGQGFRERLGWAVDIGDLNNDGFDDIVLGGPGPGGGDPQYWDGAVYVYLGAAEDADVTYLGMIPNQVWKERFGAGVVIMDLDLDGHGDLVVSAPWSDRLYVYMSNPFDFTHDAIWTPSGSGGRYGSQLASAGDVDGNGAEDLLVLDEWGSCHVLLSQGDGTVVPGPVLEGEGADHPVRAVGAAGDVNGDGFADVLTGEPDYSLGGGSEALGRFSLFHGGTTMDAVAELTVEGSYLEFGTLSQVRLGTSVSGVGDVNNDGVDDFLVGSDVMTGVASQSMLYLGGAALDAEADHIIQPFLWGTSSDDRAGYVVGPAGDLDGDGVREMLIQAPGECGVPLPGTSCGPFPAFPPRVVVAELEMPAFADCNGNGVSDVCDIDAGTSVDVDLDGVPDECTGATGAPVAAGPLGTGLMAIKPNPSAGGVHLDFSLARESDVDLAVFDVRGRRVTTLTLEVLPAGVRTVRWDTRDAHGRPVASGVYFVRLAAGDQVSQRRVVITR